MIFLSSYQYATSWSMISSNSTSTCNILSSFKRRRKLSRIMIIDDQPLSKALPYDLNIKIQRAELTSKDAQIYPSFVEVYFNNTFLDKTLPIIQSSLLSSTTTLSSSSTTPSSWNKGMSKKIMNIDNDLILTFGIYVKKISTLSIANVSKVLTLGLASNHYHNNNHHGSSINNNNEKEGQNKNNNSNENIFKCSGQIQIKQIYPNYHDVGSRDIKVQLITPLGQNGGFLYLKLELIETKLFSIQSIMNIDTCEQLKNYVENNLPFNLKKNIRLIDNAHQNLLQIFTSTIIECKDIITEGDLYDLISETSFLQQYNNNDNNNDDNDYLQQKELTLLQESEVPYFPSSKLIFSKLITLSSSLDEERNNDEILQNNNNIIVKENILSRKNEEIEMKFPAMSSVYYKDDIPVLAFDYDHNNSSNSKNKDDRNEYYEIEIQTTYHRHHIKWSNYIDYIHTIRELMKIQHLNQNFKYLHEISSSLPSPFSTKAFYNSSSPSTTSSLASLKSIKSFNNWKLISFTIDAEAEYLVLREINTLSSSNVSDGVCDQLISFEHVS